MFNREETSRIRQEFWTVFGKYMVPVPSSEGVRVNWINYHTGIKDVYFRMNVEQNSAAIYISIEHSDPEIQELYFQQFKEMKSILHAALYEEWDWQLHIDVNGKVISRIYKELPNTSVFNKDQWPELISFFKPRIIALDQFWENGKYGFEELR
ncbi:MAG: DUF4268 domain-containing protein [Cyclobacteriaceae bacterium]|nr:DUF4268 domain-containing protein [Cyclobacteriaceae bacterium]